MKLLVSVVFMVALVAAGVFFAIEGLSRADQFASVGAFLLALLVAGFTAVNALRRPSLKEPETVTQDGNTAINCGAVSMGSNSHQRIVIKNPRWR
ncbi:hypothetical protein [Micromonospora orduensis]|uniref:hypothetical protein n=1 Tax=Micromonospora orduensis TaxID=1420891 RepID=UPI0033D66C65